METILVRFQCVEIVFIVLLIDGLLMKIDLGYGPMPKKWQTTVLV